MVKIFPSCKHTVNVQSFSRRAASLDWCIIDTSCCPTTFDCFLTSEARKKKSPVWTQLLVRPSAQNWINNEIHFAAFEPSRTYLVFDTSREHFENAPTRLLIVSMFLQTSERKNETVSYTSVTFKPKPEDDGHILKCRAENLLLSNASLEDFLLLNVLCK